uniref:TEP1-F n=1 Tax=Caenorhabditis tropicalis TaxID=1561998 RepID=A0A1I7TL17_9PELO
MTKKLYIRGETLNSEVIFENEKELKFDQKALSVFIQTDRAIYRPASLVRYRAIVVKSDLKPYVGNATIKVFDPSRNLISQTIDVPLDRGVYSGELQLAEETLLGDWTIEVETSNGMQDKSSFTVDTYVLPKFEVNIKTSSFITINDDLSVFVDAKYTYGKGVAGKAKVSLELPWHRWHAVVPAIVDDNGNKKEEELMVERTVKLNRQGEAAVVFSNDELKRHKLLHEWGGGSIRIVASVTEDITEIERNATHQISTFREEVKLDVEKQGDTFKPGLTYNVVVALKQMDDTPVKATLPKKVQVSTFYNYPYNHDTSSLQEEKETKIVEVDAHGTSVLTLQPPINCTSARIEAHYDIGGKDNFTATPIYSSLYVEAAVSPTKSFLQLLADNEGAVDAGKSLSFSLKATQPLSTITYQVGRIRGRADNSFSAFGDSDKAGSTWLTAFVVRSFHHAKQYAFVDPNVISRAVAFLNSQQMESGAFAERGEVHHKDMQGGAQDGGVALTAFVLISILENGMENGKAVGYLEKHLDEVAGNAYTMAVVAYALQLAKSKQAGKAFEMLKKHKVVEKSGDIKFASAQKKTEKPKESRAYMFQARPVDIETTSYAVLSYLSQNQTSEALSIIRWLVSQRNELGGFTSTQDTVMALQALSSYAAVTYSDKHLSQVNIQNGKHSHSFDVNLRNSIVLQSYQLSSLNDGVTITANGSGVVFAQLSYSYYRDSLNDDAPFFCSQEIKEMRAGNRLQLDLCCNYTRSGRSNMALAEIDALSGYRFDAEQVHTLTSIEDLQRVEMEKDDTKMNVYFNPLKMTYSAKQTRSLQEKCGDDCWPPISPSLPPSDESTVTGTSSSRSATWCALTVAVLLRLLA